MNRFGFIRLLGAGIPALVTSFTPSIERCWISRSSSTFSTTHMGLNDDVRLSNCKYHQQQYRYTNSQLKSSITLGQPEDIQQPLEGKRGISSTTTPTTIEPQQQFWLDLRGTAVNPNEAIKFLSELLDVERMEDYIDKIILRSSDVDRASVANNVLLCQILLEDDDGLLKSIDDNEKESSFGTIMVLNEAKNTGLDPLAALDAVSQGQWYVIYPPKHSDDKQQNPVTDQITNVVKFLSSASVSSDTSSVSAGGLFLSASKPITNDDNDTTNNNNNNVRIGVVCLTQNMLVQVDSIFSESYYSNLVGATTTTGSGLVIPAFTDIDDAGAINKKSSQSSLISAIILPFDSELWQTAIALRSRA